MTAVRDHVRKQILILLNRKGNAVKKPTDPPREAAIMQTIEREGEHLFGAPSLVQGSEAWKQARCGSLGASCVHEVVARTKTGISASRANRLAAIVLERITGRPEETYQNAAMLHGTETEPLARVEYEFMRDVEVQQVGLIRHPFIANTHASPDGLIGEDGMLEIKCPQPAAHLDFLLTGKIPDKYVIQCLWQLACSGRKWVDFVSYSPAFPAELQMVVKRVEHDVTRVAELSQLVEEFLAEVDTKVAELRRRYSLEPTPSPVHEALRASVAAL